MAIREKIAGRLDSLFAQRLGCGNLPAFGRCGTRPALAARLLLLTYGSGYQTLVTTVAVDEVVQVR